MLELSIAGPTSNLLGVGTYEDYKILPEWNNLSLSAEAGRPSVMTFTYPRTGVRAHMLTLGARVRAFFPFTTGPKLFGGDWEWLEPPNMVFTVTDISYNEEMANDQTMAVALTSTLTQMEKVLLAPAIGSSYVDDDIFKFDNMTVGHLVRTCVSAALSRSPNTDVVMSFDDTYDSAGVEWGRPLDVKFDPGQSLWSVLEWLNSLGFAYATFGLHKRYIPSQDVEYLTSDLVEDKASTTYYFNLYSQPLRGFGLRNYFLDNRYINSLTKQSESKEVVNQIFVTGEEGICGWLKREDSILMYGVQEGKWSVSNAALHTTILAAGERYLDVYAYPRTSETLDMEFPPDGAILFYFPTFFYDVGDGHSIEMLSLQVESSNHIGQLTLTIDNYFDRRKDLLEQRLARLGLGS